MADQSYEGYAPSHMGCFGGYGAKPGVLEVLVRPAKIIGSVLILTILILALVVRTLYAGCNIIPSASPKDRRDDLCLSQGKQPGCTLKGDIEIGFGGISEILAAPGVELVGPLPAAIQNYTLFAAGIAASSKQQEAGKALIQFLSSPAAAAVLKAKSFDRP